MIQNDKKILNIWDVVLMTMAANFGIRWISVAAGIGPASIVFWIFGALLFFIPLAVITAQMARAYPNEGGLYAWIEHTFNQKYGFMVAWVYWVNNIFFYPAVLIFLASNLAYFLGRPELTQNSHYIIYTSLIGFWAIVFISFLGLKASKYFVNMGGVLGLFLPMTLLIVFGVLAYVTLGGSATDFSLSHFIPNGKIFGNLSSLAMIMFAMAGVEVIATFANRVRHPKRDLYFGLLLGSVLILALYLAGTVAMNVLAAPEELQKTSGIMQAFAIIGQKFHFAWLPRVMAGCLILAELAAVVIWLLAPIIMFFKCTPRGILPNWMHRTDKNGTPINALLFQGVLVSLVIIITSLLPNVNAMYQVLVLMATILYFIPYLFLAAAYVRSIKTIGVNKYVGYALAGGVFFSVILGIVVSFFPSEDLKTTHDILCYEMELVLGPLLLLGLGGILYRFRRAE